MKGFIIKKEDAGEHAIPVSHIRNISIFNIARKWRVQIDFFNGEYSFTELYTDEAEAREFYNYCLKQIAEWQDNTDEIKIAQEYEKKAYETVSKLANFIKMLCDMTMGDYEIAPTHLECKMKRLEQWVKNKAKEDK